MHHFATLEPFDPSGALRVVVESPAGAGIKLKYTSELGAFRYGRPLPSGLRYPCEWGFVPGTLGPDGDPVDAMVLAEVPTFPGIVITTRPLGVIQLEQDDREHRERIRNDRIVAVPVDAPRLAAIQTYGELPDRLRAELESFLLGTVAFENKHAVILGHGDGAAAHALVGRHRA
jgi:inorganic pyrophosphatase